MKRFFTLCVMLVTWCAMALAQERVPFNGLVIDGSGKGVARVKVQVKNTEKYTMTDKQGRFGLTNVAGDAVLEFSRKGIYVEIPVEGRRSMRVILVGGQVSGAEESEELINTGYGYVKQRERTSSSGVITSEQLLSMGQMDLEEALLGCVPGLTRSNGTLSLRASSSINASSAVLIMVDGMEVSSLTSISINEVESVSVIKDGSMYGARGANGVLVVKLKGSN